MIRLSFNTHVPHDTGKAWVVTASAFAAAIGPSPVEGADLRAPGPATSTMHVRFSDAATIAPEDPSTIRPNLEVSMAILEREVHDLKRLAGWDGEDAPPITKSTCRTAVALLRHIRDHTPNTPRPSVAASATGAVALRWMHGRQGLLVRVHASAPETVTYLIGGGGLRPQQGKTDWPGITERLQRFLAPDAD